MESIYPVVEVVGWLLWAGGQWDKKFWYFITSIQQILKLIEAIWIDSWSNGSVGRDLWLVIEGNAIVRFSEPFSVNLEALFFLIDPYY